MLKDSKRNVVALFFHKEQPHPPLSSNKQNKENPQSSTKKHFNSLEFNENQLEPVFFPFSSKNITKTAGLLGLRLPGLQQVADRDGREGSERSAFVLLRHGHNTAVPAMVEIFSCLGGTNEKGEKTWENGKNGGGKRWYSVVMFFCRMC